MKQQKTMWAILHVPSQFWDSGDSNLLLYWDEHEARLAASQRGGGLRVWKPLKVTVTVQEGRPARPRRSSEG